MRVFSLQELFGLMVNRGAHAAMEAVAAVPEDTASQPTSIRLNPRTRAYYEAQAEALGAPSASAVMAMVLEGVMKATRPSDGVSSTEAVREGINLVKERFLHLFRVHGFTPHMIADVLRPHGIGLADLMDDQKLLPLLTDQVLEEQAERFAIQPDWLHGKPVMPVALRLEIHKNPAGLCRDIVNKLKEHNNRIEITVLFLRGTGADFQAAFVSETNSGGYIGAVVRQTFKTPGDRPYHRYEAWRTVPWAYSETRLAVKVIILWLMRLSQATHYRVRFEGVEVDSNVLLDICDRGGLPAGALETGPYSWLKHWEPRDYVEDGAGCKETSERPTALEYYGYHKMDKLFEPLEPYVRAEVLAVPIGGPAW
jgi:hypothetical protein